MTQTLGYLTYRVLAGLFGLLPEPVMRRIGLGLGYAASFLARGKFRMALRHQRRVLGEDADAVRSARRVFAQYGRYWAETFWLRPRRRDFLIRNSDVPTVEYLHAAATSGRGLILALPHIGNWEVAGLRAAYEGARVLDLFAGVGSMGLEAASRGAAQVLMVERSRPIFRSCPSAFCNCHFCTPARSKAVRSGIRLPDASACS